jgi:hypothetical protein
MLKRVILFLIRVNSELNFTRNSDSLISVRLIFTGSSRTACIKKQKTDTKLKSLQ